jgi:aerobic carbon-monoxide dehydrogenase medium subunit
VKATAFDYHAPTTIDETVALLAELDDAKLIAGGQSLVPLMALRLATFEHIIDLRKVEGVRGIEERDGEVWIGAATTQAAVEHDPTVAEKIPMLAEAIPLIGHFQIRNRGTIGGSLVHADPAAELPRSRWHSTPSSRQRHRTVGATSPPRSSSTPRSRRRSVMTSY